MEGTDMEAPVMAEAAGQKSIGEMTDRELLMECVRNQREIIGIMQRVADDINEAMGSPMLAGVMKMFGRSK